MTETNGLRRTIDKYPHISDEEIKRDIEDTKAEIMRMSMEEMGYRMIGDRISLFKADNRIIGIRERKEFIEKLTQILLNRNLPPKE